MDISSLYKLIGPAGCVLIFVAVLSIYLCLRNVFYLYFVQRDFFKTFSGGLPLDLKAVETAAGKDDNPLVLIVLEAMHCGFRRPEDIRTEISYLFHQHFESVVKSLQYIRLISVLSPLLGLLGTILGMVGVFKTIAADTAPDPALLATGIWEALITTIMGLCVAIPSLIFFYYLNLKLRGFRLQAVRMVQSRTKASASVDCPATSADAGKD